MPRYDELEHDSHEDPVKASALPAGLSSPVDPGADGPETSPVRQLRQKAREALGRDEWMHPDNPALWEGDVDDD